MLLSENWFRQFPQVDSDSLDFQAALAYWMKNTGAIKSEIIKDAFNGIQQGPDEIDFTMPDGRVIKIEAKTAAFAPDRALIDLQIELGLFNAPVPPWVRPSEHLPPPPPPPPPPPVLNPIGPPLEGQDAPRYFHSLSADKRPEGTIWPDPNKPEEVAVSQQNPQTKGHSYYKQVEIMFGPVWYQLT